MEPMNEEQLREYLNKEDLKTLHELKINLDDIYYNTDDDTGVKDWQYDMLKDILQIRDPGYIIPVGAKVRNGENRTRLPCWMGSMDKIKTDPQFQNMSDNDLRILLQKNSNEELRIKIQDQISQLRTINKWIAKNEEGPFILEDKLDGISCLLVYENRDCVKIYTRGDGYIGANISYLAPYFNIPEKLDDDIAVRGELIMKLDVFNEKYASKYANPRNLVAGRTGAKVIKDGLCDIEFIAYELIEDKGRPPTKQLDYLNRLGFVVVSYQLFPEINLETLAKHIVSRKEESPFEIDGIIVQSNKSYKRNTSGNPDYAFAFKMRLGENVLDATVVSVVWSVSKWGKLKPRVKIVPIHLMGSTVEFASGKNAKFIYTNKIGPGAIIKITKGGEIIPDILSIVKSAKTPDMPTIPWKWNETEVDILTVDNHEDACIKLMQSFFHQLGFKNLGMSTINKLYENKIDSILKILSVTKKELVSAGFGKGQAKVIFDSIRSTLNKGLDICDVIGSSGVLGQGIGKKRVSLLLESYPDILDPPHLPEKELIEKIGKVEGFADVIAESIAKNLHWASKFVESLRQFTNISTIAHANTGGTLNGKTVIISGALPGYTRKEAQNMIEKAGGKFSNSVRKPKDCLAQIVVLCGDNETNKSKDAKKFSVPTCTSEALLKMIV